MKTPDATSTLDEWLCWLETLSPREIDLGLERLQAVLSRLRLELPERTLIVAGTNGKGSCVAMLEALFMRKGESVGCYTSPHLARYNERIRVDGVAADDASIVRAFLRVEAVRDDVPLTYFEYGTLAALVIFAERAPRTLVLEVGLGGRLDAVNAVSAAGCLITNVGLDHCDWLGPDVETIAAEKAGVMRAGKPAVFGGLPLPRSIERVAGDVGADLIVAGRDYRVEPRTGGWNFAGRRRRLDGLTVPSLPGPHQLENAGAVLALLEALGADEYLSVALVNEAFGALSLPGRMQREDALDRAWLLDVAHNPDAARALAEAVRLLGGRRVTAVAGVLADKDAGGIVAALCPVVDRWLVCTPSGGRALPGRELAREVTARGGEVAGTGDSPAESLAAAMALTTAEDLILVTGSFMTVGPAMAWLEAQGRTPRGG